MKDGLINTKGKDAAVLAAYTTATTAVPWLKIWPISIFVRFILDKAISAPADELQRHANYETDRSEAAKEGSESSEASRELQEIQDEGKNLEDEEAREAYERHKQEARDLIRFGGPADRSKRP